MQAQSDPPRFRSSHHPKGFRDGGVVLCGDTMILLVCIGDETLDNLFSTSRWWVGTERVSQW